MYLEIAEFFRPLLATREIADFSREIETLIRDKAITDDTDQTIVGPLIVRQFMNFISYACTADVRRIHVENLDIWLNSIADEAGIANINQLVTIVPLNRKSTPNETSERISLDWNKLSDATPKLVNDLLDNFDNIKLKCLE